MPIAAWALGELATDLAPWAAAPGAGVDAILAPAIVGAGALVCGYLALSAMVMVAAALSGSIPGWAAAAAPSAWRRIVATAAGIGLSAGLAAPALAADIAPGWSVAVVTAGVDASPGWSAASYARPAGATDAVPGWIDGPRAAEHDEAPQRGAHTHDDAGSGTARPTRVVEAGDSLWAITADLLGEKETARIAAAWPLLYEANRDVIGADPSLIRPGQILEIPEELAR
ncbi:LysM peptidoglycan-binding domain-containing protein [Demequina zhanjiangensis]|uniref:LysM domain-containing protein n=1 Tax=Demequina zhanjiangensis TaxID=3051659 RepID=A0ABT8FXT6_9MICO|nr:hypothetical protein [Demequina sp. SYSU T00b26]MDN4471695.1 hypothetical protein [Demequina sp. SYSU T00b26]